MFAYHPILVKARVSCAYINKLAASLGATVHKRTDLQKMNNSK